MFTQRVEEKAQRIVLFTDYVRPLSFDKSIKRNIRDVFVDDKQIKRRFQKKYFLTNEICHKSKVNKEKNGTSLEKVSGAFSFDDFSQFSAQTKRSSLRFIVE